MEHKPILSICIPIYNRRLYLERMLSRLLDDKEVFDNDVQLYISDNCSTEDVRGVATLFKENGLNLIYHCNKENLGMDGNFINCFNQAKGKYIWLLGSDDIPQQGVLTDLLSILKEKDYGLLHLSDLDLSKQGQIKEFEDSNRFVEEINVWITYISGNIVLREKLEGVNLDKYRGTFICQVPFYLYASLTSNKNAIYYRQFHEKENDSHNNGGYNFFNVFVENLYNIFQDFVSEGLMPRKTFERVKYLSYKNWLVGFVVSYFMKRQMEERKSLDFSQIWEVLRRHYAKCPYAYYFTLKVLAKRIVKRK